jgi:hypothetical protein
MINELKRHIRIHENNWILGCASFNFADLSFLGNSGLNKSQGFSNIFTYSRMLTKQS